jgi:hypothetical protein
MISKETLVKTIAVLEDECTEQLKKVKSLLDELLGFCIGSFFVEHIDGRYIYKEGCRITLKNADADFSFDVMDDGTVDSIGWGSHLYSNFLLLEDKHIAINNSLNYINCVREYLLLLTSKELIEFTHIVNNFYQEILLPERNKLYDIRNQINELKKEIKEQDNQVIIKEAMDFFEMNKLYAMYTPWKWNKSKSTIAYFKFSINKNQLKIKINDERNSRSISENALVLLYRHYTGKCFTFNYTANNNHYYKSNSNARNVIDGKIDYESKQEWTEITEEEYRNNKN